MQSKTVGCVASCVQSRSAIVCPLRVIVSCRTFIQSGIPRGLHQWGAWDSLITMVRPSASVNRFSYVAAQPAGLQISLPELFSRADAALYAAKAKGRNQVQLAS